MRTMTSFFSGGVLALGLTACIVDSGDDTTGGTTTAGTSPTTTTAGTDTDVTSTAGTSTGSSGGSSGGSTGGGGTAGGSSGGGSTGGGGADPDYPAPDATGACPDGFTGPITFNGEDSGTALCIPECMGTTCPSGQTGDATGACATNPDSSQTACTTDDDCTVTDESCYMMQSCLGPNTHCVLFCESGAACPDGMVCTPGETCEYEG